MEKQQYITDLECKLYNISSIVKDLIEEWTYINEFTHYTDDDISYLQDKLCEIQKIIRK
ncbi:MAG: hypothetical protein RSE41_04175 [Clostridia bacterium]